VLKEIRPDFEDRVTYLHSHCSREEVLKGLKTGEIWGVVATEILGMVCI
jgi:hypothetical protein